MRFLERWSALHGQHVWAPIRRNDGNAIAIAMTLRIPIQLALCGILACTTLPALAVCPPGSSCPSDKAAELLQSYTGDKSRYGSRSPTNPYATDAPHIVDRQGGYYGRLSANPSAPDSTANPYGRYGNQFSPDSINNSFGAGNPYRSPPLYVEPS